MRAAARAACVATPARRPTPRRRRRATVGAPAGRTAWPAGPGLVGGRVRHRPRRGPALDLCDPASPLRLEARAGGRAGAGDRGHAADRHRLRRRAVGRRAVAVRRSRASPSVSGRPRRAERGRRWTRARSRCSSSRRSATRLAERTSFAPSRRLAEALEPSSDPVIVARGLDETDQARALLEERPGVGIGAAHDIGPAIERAARGGRLDAGPVPRDRRDARRDRAPRHVARRRAAAAAARPRPRAPPAAGAALARWRAASTRSASCSTPPRRGSAGCGRRSASPTTGCGGGSTRSSASELGGALQEPIVTLRNGRYVVPVKAEARSPGQGHRPRRVGQRPDAVHRAARRRRARQRLARGAGRRGTRRSRGSSTSCRRSSAANADAAARDARRARPVRLLGGQGAARRPRWTPIRAETADRPEVVLLSARHPGPDRPRRPDRHPARRRLHGARRDRARTPAARPSRCGRSGCSRLMHQAGLHVPAAAGSRAAGLARRLRRHRRRAVDRPVAVDVLGPPALDHPDRRGGRARARSSCSTSSAPARTRPRARRWPRRCSTTSSGPARSSRRRPTTPSSRPTPTRRRRRATRRSSSTSRRCRRPTG